MFGFHDGSHGFDHGHTLNHHDMESFIPIDDSSITDAIQGSGHGHFDPHATDHDVPFGTWETSGRNGCNYEYDPDGHYTGRWSW